MDYLGAFFTDRLLIQPILSNSIDYFKINIIKLPEWMKLLLIFLRNPFIIAVTIVKITNILIKETDHSTKNLKLSPNARGS